MLANLLYKKWKNLVTKANSLGVPVPTVRDPKLGTGSISLTLVFISSLLVIIGIVGKWSKIAGDIDMNNAMEFFYASSALYFGRQWQKVGPKTEGSTDPGSTPDSPNPP
jgi:hypothetical protein